MSTHITVTWSNNWMSAIDDNTNISGISIPGTHESCARFQLGNAQCQWFSIIQQLNRGIRFLDIRCDYETGAESGLRQHIYFPVSHGIKSQQILFEEVQAQCVAFLDANPTEFILMNVQMIDGNNAVKFGEKFLELIAPYQEYWYLDTGVRYDTKGALVPNLPAIKDVRKRIVLIHAGNYNDRVGWWPPSLDCGLSWTGFYKNAESSDVVFQTQNVWEKVSGTDKGKMVENYILAAQKNAGQGQITLNFASYTDNSIPGGNAQDMNNRLQSYLPTHTAAAPVGVIAIDFTGNTGDAGDSLENLIIQRQPHQKPNYSYGGIPKWLLKISS